MNIAICDDDKIFVEKLKLKLGIYQCSIYTFYSVEELQASDIAFDIAFLDLRYENDTLGFDAVHFLKMNCKNCIVAFFTSYKEYALTGYKYRAFRYILKTEPEQAIEHQISDVFNEYKRIHKTISGSFNGYTFSTSLDDIYYIEIRNHVITLHTVKGNFEVYKQLKDLHAELADLGFVRCHRSYMVNLQHVTVLRKDGKFVMNDKQRSCIPVGIRYKQLAEQQFLNYVSVGG